MWYVPFFWSLTWFSYWILHEVLILNTPLIQVNPVNCVGAVTSILVLLLVTPRLWTTRALHNIQVETSKPQKPRVKYQSSIGKSEREKSEQATQKLIQSKSGASALSTSVSYSNQHHMSQEISSECLMCANLISCNHRRNESVESQVQGSKSIKCPFSEELSSNKTTAA